LDTSRAAARAGVRPTRLIEARGSNASAIGLGIRDAGPTAASASNGVDEAASFGMRRTGRPDESHRGSWCLWCNPCVVCTQ
jgi:hypothetical protein